MGETLSRDFVSNQHVVDGDTSGSNTQQHSSSSSSLLDAAQKGNSELVAKLLKKGKKVNKRDPVSGETPLHKAAELGHVDIVQQLLRRGADTTAVDVNGLTAFQLAAANGRIECAKLIADENPAQLTAPFAINPFNMEYSIISRSGKIYWSVGNFSKIDEKKIFSSIFYIGGCKWQLVLYPKGSKGDDSLSIYVEVADESKLPENWSYLANFSFVVVNQLTGDKKISREVVAHRFYKNHADVGFPQLVKKNILQHRKSGCIVRDKLRVEFVMDVIETSCYPTEDMIGTYTWRMTNVTHSRERVTSPVFTVGGCQWMIAVYPRGKSGGNNMSVYLKVADTASLPEGWYFLTNFKFSLINQLDGSKFTRQVEAKNFRSKVEDWGFPMFMKLNKVYDPTMGFLSDDSLIIEVQLEIIDKFVPPPSSNSPSSSLSSSGNSKMAARLAKFNVDTPIKNMRITPLHLASYAGSVEGVRELLQRQVPLNIRDRRGRTALDWASAQGHADVVALLLAHGADPNCRDKDGYSPLHKAVMNGHLECVCLLLEHNANIDAIPPAARERRKSNTPQPQNIASASQLNNEHNTSTDTTTVDTEVSEHVDQERDYYAELVARDIPLTPLHIALRTTHATSAQMLRVLIDVFCADVNIPDLKGRTPLHCAAVSGDLNLAEMLIAHGASIDAQDCDGNTPLHKAIWKGNLHIVELLTKNGADIMACSTTSGYNAFHLAVLLNDLRCVQLLVELSVSPPEYKASTNLPEISSPRQASISERRESDVVDTDAPPKKTSVRLPVEPKTSMEGFDLSNRHSRITPRPLDPSLVEAILGERGIPRMNDDSSEIDDTSHRRLRRANTATSTRARLSSGEAEMRSLSRGQISERRALDDLAVRRSASGNDLGRHVQINAPPSRSDRVKQLRKSDPLLMSARHLVSRLSGILTSRADSSASDPLEEGKRHRSKSVDNANTTKSVSAASAATAPSPFTSSTSSSTDNNDHANSASAPKKLKSIRSGKVLRLETDAAQSSAASQAASPPLSPKSSNSDTGTMLSTSLPSSNFLMADANSPKKEKPVLRKASSLLDIRNKWLVKRKSSASGSSSEIESTSTSATEASDSIRQRPKSPSRVSVNFIDDAQLLHQPTKGVSVSPPPSKRSVSPPPAKKRARSRSSVGLAPHNIVATVPKPKRRENNTSGQQVNEAAAPETIDAPNEPAAPESQNSAKQTEDELRASSEFGKSRSAASNTNQVASGRRSATGSWKTEASAAATPITPTRPHYPLQLLINTPNAHGVMPLHTAVKQGMLVMAKFLVSLGADVNARAKDGTTPLDLAATNRDAPLIVFLLENGAVVSQHAKQLLQFVSQRVPSVRLDDFTCGISTFSNDVRMLLNNAAYSDVTFIVENKPIYAWKGLLCARSEVFRAMFFSSLRESAENTIEITGMSFSTFWRVIEYIYTDTLDHTTLTVEEALNLLGAANRYILERLKRLVERWLFNAIDDYNVYSIFQAADLYDASALRSACVLYIASNSDRFENVNDVVNNMSFRKSVSDFLANTLSANNVV